MNMSLSLSCSFLSQSQAELAERQIKAEFQKFHHFLIKEKEARLTALKKEVEKKRGKVEERIEREIFLISDQVREVEEEMEAEDGTFIQVKLLTHV